MRYLCSLLLIFLMVAVPILASAVDFFGQSRTYLQSRESGDGNTFLPLYEYLDLHAEKIGGKNISFHFGGWARVDLADRMFEKKTNNDLQYAYLSFRKSTGNTALNLGRFFAYEGAVSALIDGAYARTDLAGGIGVAAFGGVPVETNFDGRGSDSVFGGRISQGYPGVYRVGVAYLKEKNNRTDFREEEGIDLWVRPVNKVEILGTSQYNALTSAWMRHDYFLTLGPFRNLSIRPEVMYISYKDYFTGATLSAFTFGPTGLPNPEEKLSTAGGEVLYSFGKAVLSADYKKYSYDIAGAADYYGAKLTYSNSPSWGTGLAFHRMNGETDSLNYYEYRAYGYKKLGKADITADFFGVTYDTEINGVKNAYSASLAGGYFIRQRTRIAADIEYAHNPFFDKEVRGLIKLVWSFGNSSGETGRK